MVINNKSLYKILFLSIWLLSGIRPVNTMAQTVEPEAKMIHQVLDTYGSPVNGVKITIKGSGHITTTGIDGQFELPFTVGDVLTYTHPKFTYHEARVSKLDIDKGVRVHLQEELVTIPDYIPGQ